MKKFLKSEMVFSLLISLMFYGCLSNTYSLIDSSVEEITINTKEDLIEFRDLVNRESEPLNFYGKTVVLNADINLNNENFDPIGNGESYFSGTFKGNNHTISNIKMEGNGFVGLFGIIDHAVIQDLTLNNVEVNGSGDVGALVGQSVFSKIKNCKVTNLNMSLKVYEVKNQESQEEKDSISDEDINEVLDEALKEAQKSVGTWNNASEEEKNAALEEALKAAASSAGVKVYTSEAEAEEAEKKFEEDLDVGRDSIYMGGLVGYNNADISVNYFEEFNYDDPTALIENCSAQGSINIDGSIQYGSVGGLVGVNHGSSDASKEINSFAKIVNSNSDVNIKVEKQNDESKMPVVIMIGGFVGSNCDYNGVKDKGALIDSCYASGSIDAGAIAAYSWVGGFVGYEFNYQGNARIKNCGASGKVIGSQTFYSEGGFCHAGGFAGSMNGVNSVSSFVKENMAQNADNRINSLSIENCYYKGSVSSNANSEVCTGGFIGNVMNHYSDVQIINCYSAAEISEIDDETIDEKELAGFCACIETGEDSNEHSCKLEKCYYDKDLSKLDAVSRNNGDVKFDINALTTSECKSDNGLVKSLNDNITNLSKTDDWTKWTLYSGLDGYPINKLGVSNTDKNNSSGAKKDKNNMLIIIVSAAAIVTIGALIVVYVTKRKRV